MQVVFHPVVDLLEQSFFFLQQHVLLPEQGVFFQQQFRQVLILVVNLFLLGLHFLVLGLQFLLLGLQLAVAALLEPVAVVPQPDYQQQQGRATDQGVAFRLALADGGLLRFALLGQQGDVVVFFLGPARSGAGCSSTRCKGNR